jgi:hypothetical protein
MAGRQRGVQRGRRECARTGRSEQGRRFLGRTSLALRAGDEVPRDLDRAGSRHAAGPHMAWRETVLPLTTAANKQFARVCVAATSGSGELVPPWPLQTCSGASCCALEGSYCPPTRTAHIYVPCFLVPNREPSSPPSSLRSRHQPATRTKSKSLCLRSVLPPLVWMGRGSIQPIKNGP